jgi:hypothetical protein
MSRGFLSILAAAMFAQIAVGAASAAEYLFLFEPKDAHLTLERADNRASLTATLALLQDYGTAAGMHFVLVGDLPAECLAAADCEARSLQQRRVEAIQAAMAALPDGMRSVRQLQWQPIPVKPDRIHAEALRLLLRVDPPAVFSGQCPYQLQVTDPRLPAELEVLGEEPTEWVPMRGLTAVPVSSAASMRVTPSVRNSGTVTVTQRLNDHDALLGSGSAQAQWSAGQLQWNADAADVDIDSASQPRDIGNVILPWDENPRSLPNIPTKANPATTSSTATTADPATASITATAQGYCRVHFVLRR